MAEDNDLQGLIGAFQLECRGCNKAGGKVLSEENAESVVVKVYKDGSSEPLCRYLKKDAHLYKCIALSLDKESQDNGHCPQKSSG
jgi:hypothetical protein